MKRILFMVLAIVLLLSAGCDRQPPAPSTEPAGTRPSSAPTETTVQKETEPDLAAASLVSLRQALVDTPQQFAVAYLGFLEAENADPVAFIRENVPSLCADLPFLTAFGPEDVVGSRGEVYCIVPAEGVQVRLSHILRDEYGWIIGTEEFLMRDTDAPFLLLCSPEGITDTELLFQNADGSALTWQAERNHLGRVKLPQDHTGVFLAQDFSAYTEMLEQTHLSLAKSGWLIPTAQVLTGTSWYWDCWVDSESIYLEYDLLFEEGTAFVRWYDNIDGDYAICAAAPWSLEYIGNAALLTLDFGGFAGERSYHVLISDSGDSLFIMSGVLTGNPPLDGEGLCRYMERSDLSEAPDPMEMVGSWQRLYFEVEGYREDSQPGDVTVEIGGTTPDTLTVSYSEKAFPENGYRNQSLLIQQRQMYPGCGNARWVAEVAYEGSFDTYYTLTLLTDDRLLLQNYWIMDGAPMVSYEWFERIS